VNRERWTSFPAATGEERALLRAMNAGAARRTVTVVGVDGRERPLEATLSIEVAEPFDGKADVAVRLAFDGAGPGDGERFVGDPWALLDLFLRDAEAEARRSAAEAR
jgi:hypothetical protein